MKKREMNLSFDSYTSARLPSGVFLFLPEWYAKVDGEPDGGIHFVVIKLSNQHRQVDAAVVGEILHIGLNATRFHKLGERFRRRDLKKEPAKFSFDVDDAGAVTNLRVDGVELAKRKRC